MELLGAYGLVENARISALRFLFYQEATPWEKQNSSHFVLQFPEILAHTQRLELCST
jgi:hypothetical protein